MSALTRRILRAMAVAGLWLAGIAHAGTVHYYYTDPQGTVLAKADAQGNIVSRNDYAPYGSAAPNLDAAPDGPGYTGHVNDPETGLVYMQARYYDPVVGRFLSVDPVGPSPKNVFNFNRFVYASNNPIGNIDPDGRNCEGLLCSGYKDASQSCEIACIAKSKATWKDVFASMMRGIFAHSIIEANIQQALPNAEVKAEKRIGNILDGSVGRVDIMIRNDSSEAWNIFDIKPLSQFDSNKSRSSAMRQIQGYMDTMRNDGESVTVGRWSRFFPNTEIRSVNIDTGITLGGVRVGGSYFYASPRNDGIIYYWTGDPMVTKK